MQTLGNIETLISGDYRLKIIWEDLKTPVADNYQWAAKAENRWCKVPLMAERYRLSRVMQAACRYALKAACIGWLGC